MSKHYMGTRAVVDVAVGLDQDCKALIGVARQISLRTGMRLRLVHAVDPFACGLPAPLIDVAGPLGDYAGVVDDCRKRAAEKRLEVLQMELTRLSPEKHVTLGHPADAVMADATANDVQLILAGAGRRTYDATLRGFSTALRLMAEAAQPVVIVGQACERDLNRPRLKMLVADDLTPSSEAAMRNGLDFARALGDTDILHVHVNPVTAARVHEVALALNKNAEAPQGDAFDENEVLAAVDFRLRESLATRAPERRALLAARGCTYRTEIATGGTVAEAVKHLAEDHDADIVVFGRHHGLHRHPFAFGKVSHREMLAQKRIVMIVPPQ